MAAEAKSKDEIAGKSGEHVEGTTRSPRFTALISSDYLLKLRRKGERGGEVRLIRVRRGFGGHNCWSLRKCFYIQAENESGLGPRLEVNFQALLRQIHDNMWSLTALWQTRIALRQRDGQKTHSAPCHSRVIYHSVR